MLMRDALVSVCIVRQVEADHAESGYLEALVCEFLLEFVALTFAHVDNFCQSTLDRRPVLHSPGHGAEGRTKILRRAIGSFHNNTVSLVWFRTRVSARQGSSSHREYVDQLLPYIVVVVGR